MEKEVLKFDPRLASMTKCPQDRISTFLHHGIDGVCEKTRLQYQDYSSVWTLEEWWDLTDAFQEFCKTVVKCGWSKDQVKDYLSTLPEDFRQHNIDAIWVRREEIRHWLINRTAAISNAQLQDFDWKLKLVMASDKLATVQEPLMSLDLDIKDQQKNKMVHVEMNKEELGKLINSLEAANKAVLQLKTS